MTTVENNNLQEKSKGDDVQDTHQESQIETENQPNNTYVTNDKTRAHTFSPTMPHEIFATWIATAIFVAIFGSAYCNREAIDPIIRATLHIISLGGSLFIMVWATFSFYNLLDRQLHTVLLYLILIYLAIFIVYVGVLAVTLQL